ncbi:hypothetical protein RJT34_08860 [Clitoria ternatea]|uniref:Uncharacterized protein n=1 Tax=Clitoria ternatea TaxID=43366 RepID=A0AAN9PW11_CLITE
MQLSNNLLPFFPYHRRFPLCSFALVSTCEIQDKLTYQNFFIELFLYLHAEVLILTFSLKSTSVNLIFVCQGTRFTSHSGEIHLNVSNIMHEVEHWRSCR